MEMKQMSLVDLEECKAQTDFDLSDIYENEIEPLIRKIRERCIMHRMPMFSCVCTENNMFDTKYRFEVVHGSIGRSLTDDKIASLLLAHQGFDHDLPVYVRDAMATLTGYLNRYEENRIDVKLSKDEIADFIDISKGAPMNIKQ